jgi:hypothetical protein
VHADKVAVGVGDVYRVTSSAGGGHRVADAADVEAGEQIVEVGAGSDREAQGVEAGERGGARRRTTTRPPRREEHQKARE